MKTLFLVRHGKSSWEFPGLSDKERPLKGRGKRDAKLMGERLAKQKINPDLIISSPAKRALATAKIMAGEMDYDQHKIKKDDRIYFEGTYGILEVVQEVDDKVGVLFVFGHNPDFTTLANEFSRTRIDNVPTSGVACIALDIDEWQKAGVDNGKLKFFDYPSRHR